MRVDEQVIHVDDIQAGSGAEFYGTPVREVCPFDVDIREQDDMQRRVRAYLGIDFAAVEVLPGEVVKDDIIRRDTTAEAVGDAFYEQKNNALYFDLDLPKKERGWKTEDLLDENGKMLKVGAFFPEAPDSLRRTFKAGVWYDAQGKVVQL